MPLNFGIFTVMDHIRNIYKYLIVIVLGMIVFLVDRFELTNPFLNEVILLVISLLKSAYFIFFVFRTIRESTKREFFFHEFMTFMVVSILLVILSFALDYYCLFRINPGSFLGIIPKSNFATEFIGYFYYSISVFTTAGFGDIRPNSTTAQVFVSTELMIAFFFTILVISNISNIRSSLVRKDGSKTGE